MRQFIVMLFALGLANLAYCQEAEEKEDHTKHGITLSIAHTHVGEGVANGKKKALALPAWGLNYDFHINEAWSLGLHTDMIIEEFEVEVEGASILSTLKRTRPFSTAITVSHRMNDFLLASIGVGKEFSPEENFNLIRVGLEPYFELPNNYEIVGTFAIDFRFDAYNAFTIGLGISKRF